MISGRVSQSSREALREDVVVALAPTDAGAPLPVLGVVFSPGAHSVDTIRPVKIPAAAVVPQPFLSGDVAADLGSIRFGAKAVALADPRINNEVLATMGAAPSFFVVMFVHRPFWAGDFPAVANQQPRPIGSWLVFWKHGLMGRASGVFLHHQTPMVEIGRR